MWFSNIFLVALKLLKCIVLKVWPLWLYMSFFWGGGSFWCSWFGREGRDLLLFGLGREAGVCFLSIPAGSGDPSKDARGRFVCAWQDFMGHSVFMNQDRTAIFSNICHTIHQQKTGFAADRHWRMMANILMRACCAQHPFSPAESLAESEQMPQMHKQLHPSCGCFLVLLFVFLRCFSVQCNGP